MSDRPDLTPLDHLAAVVEYESIIQEQEQHLRPATVPGRALEDGETTSSSGKVATSSEDERPINLSHDGSASPEELPDSPVQVATLPPRPSLARAGTDPHLAASTSTAPRQPILPARQQQDIHTTHSRRSLESSLPRERPRRYADPDAHWLSEDEGESMARDVGSSGGWRSARRNRHSSHNHGGSSGDRESPSDPDKEGVVAYMSADTRGLHAIHHKPSTYSADPMVASPYGKAFISNFADMQYVPYHLLRALSCRSCNKLLQDPTTLLCGHSLCLGCSAPDATPAQVERVATTPITVVHQALIPNSTTPPKSPPTSPPKSPKAIMADVVCPIVACSKLTKAKSEGREGLRPDVVLQKLTELIRAYVARSAIGLSEGDAAAQDFLSRFENKPVSERRNEHKLPTSSPEESPADDELSKRHMSKQKAWQTSKRMRGSSRGSPKPSSTPTLLAGLVSDVLSELECQVCVMLIYEPMTTPCGHTFCKRCLFRSLDHSSRCPLCRTELPGFNFFISSPINSTIENLMVSAFSVLYTDRKQAVEQEQADTGLDTPIFVCMVAFPFMPTNLHIYEPRYRLMMRRALDTNKRFGMVLPARNNGGISQYGTMLEIQDAHLFDDGRSLVRTVGVHRFKILESGTMDGYTVGRVERVYDISDEEEEELERLAIARGAAQASQRAAAAVPTQSSPGHPPTSTTPQPVPASTPSETPATPAAPQEYPEAATDNSELTNKELMGVCRGFIDALRTGSTPWLIQRLNDSMPPMPTDPREFTWWMAMLMPIDDHEKAKLLQITSYRLRLRLLAFWIQQMQHSWWFNRGCTIS